MATALQTSILTSKATMASQVCSPGPHLFLPSEHQYAELPPRWTAPPLAPRKSRVWGTGLQHHTAAWAEGCQGLTDRRENDPSALSCS